jgi:hypothetical protein
VQRCQTAGVPTFVKLLNLPLQTLERGCVNENQMTHLLFVGVRNEVHGLGVGGYFKRVRLVDDVLCALDGQALLYLDHAPRNGVLHGQHNR